MKYVYYKFLSLSLSLSLSHYLSPTLSDHLVMLGNHHDAWTFGATDPNSGTAGLMDIARVLGDLRNTGKNLYRERINSIS